MIIIAVPKLEVKKHYSLNSYSWLFFFFWSSAFFLKYKTENQWNIEFTTLNKISLQISLNLLIPLCKLVMGFLSWWLWLSSRRIGLEESEASCGSAALNTQALFSDHCVAPSPLSSFRDLLAPLWVHQAFTRKVSSLPESVSGQRWEVSLGLWREFPTWRGKKQNKTQCSYLVKVSAINTEKMWLSSVHLVVGGDGSTGGS